MTTSATDRPVPNAARQTRYLAGILAEHALLALAIFMIIPAVPSTAGQRYHFGGAPLAMMLFFLVSSRLLAIYRGQETWFGLALKAAILTVAGFVNYERVFIG